MRRHRLGEQGKHSLQVFIENMRPLGYPKEPFRLDAPEVGREVILVKRITGLFPEADV